MSSERFLSDLLTAERAAEIPDFLSEREKQLVATTQPVTFSGAGERVTFNYIHPESTVKASAYSKGFMLNDSGSHTIFAAASLDLAKTLEDESPDTIVIKAAQLALMQYMGFPSHNAARERKRLLGGLFRGQKKGISDMAASGVAMCMERASVTHNMCLLSGLQSIFLTGTTKTDNINSHAFQIVHTDNENQLFDSTNPSIEIKDSSVLLKPTLAPVRVAEFLIGASVVSTQIKVKSDTARQVTPIEYSFQPAFPATFEGFGTLGFQGRQDLGNLSKREYQQKAILDIIQTLMKTRFAADSI